MHKSILAILLILFCRGSSFGQFGIDSAIYATINQLRTTKADMIIRFDRPGIRISSFSDTLKGIGAVYPFEIYYLLYHSKGKAYGLKFIEYTDGKGEQMNIAVSHPYETDTDTLFSWLRGSLDTIKNEEILPYIYTFTVNNRTYYDYPYVSDELGYLIGIYTSDGDVVKQFKPHYLEQRLDPRSSPNLNYDNNQRTRLLQLYHRLEHFVNGTDKQYSF